MIISMSMLMIIIVTISSFVWSEVLPPEAVAAAELQE